MTDLKTLKEFSDANFEGIDKDGLMELCLSFGLTPHANAGPEKLKTVLRDELARKSGAKKLDQTLIRGLMGFPWHGQRKLVLLRRPDSALSGNKYPVNWSGNIINVPYNHRETSIPWPHFLILQGTEHGRVIKKKTAEGSVPEYDTVISSKHNIDDLGDDPNSKTKWKSLNEYLASEWGIIEHMSTRDKVAVLTQVTDGHITRSYVDVKKWDDEDVDRHLRALLGIADKE